MFWKLSNRITSLILPDSEEDDKEIYRYGLWILITTVFHWLEILLLGLLLHCVTESIIYLLILMVLRSYTGGYHATTSSKCNWLGIGCFIVNVVLSKVIVMIDSKLLMVIILLFVEIIIFWKAPIEHENKPLSDTEKVRYRKYSILLSIGICLLSILLYNRYIYEVSFAVVTMSMVGFMMVLELMLQRMRTR